MLVGAMKNMRVGCYSYFTPKRGFLRISYIGRRFINSSNLIQASLIENLVFKSFVVSKPESRIRLDRILANRFPLYSRTYFESLITKEYVFVNQKLLRKSSRLNAGDRIDITFATVPEGVVNPEPILLDILYEDAYLIAVNKPVGMVVHPGAGNEMGTFASALLYHAPQVAQIGSLRPGIVHRLDKDTSGVLLAAKDEETQKRLKEAFAKRQIYKEYRAICIGNPGCRLIEGKIGRHFVRRQEMAVVFEGGKEASTLCETLAYDQQISHVKLLPYTGRTHQIRVHMKHVGFPILGDPIYGIKEVNKKFEIKRQLLHAFCLRFIHPYTKEDLEIFAPLPQDFIKVN